MTVKVKFFELQKHSFEFSGGLKNSEQCHFEEMSLMGCEYKIG